MKNTNSKRNTQKTNPSNPESDEKRLQRLKEWERLGVKDITKELEGTFFVYIKLRKNKKPLKENGVLTGA